MNIVSIVRKTIAGLIGTRQHTRNAMIEGIIGASDKMRDWDETRLLQVSHELRWKARCGESLTQMTPTAFALVREALRRVYGMKLFPVQVYAGLVMADGDVAEMETGEGKTVSALQPVYLRALSGQGCHVLTTNDYLAARDAGLASLVLARLGMTVGSLSNSLQPNQRRHAYACDVTYGTEKEFGFDFLRDRLQRQARSLRPHEAQTESVQRGHYFALVDEADSIMIDQARTPLVIATNQECSPGTLSLLQWSDCFAQRLQNDNDFRYRPELRSAILTKKGYQRVLLESKPQVLASHNSEVICRQVERALTARLGFSPERDYVVIDGKVQIVDESTGRILEGRKWQDRLHQAIEVRERLTVSSMTRETARISVQSYLRQYAHLAGMTGTAVAVRRELNRVYSVDVQRIPVHVPSRRQGMTPRIFLTMNDKLTAVIGEIRTLQQQGRAVLVGTPSVRASEMLSSQLLENGIEHKLLHAKHDHDEAAVIARAGQSGSVVVATNMAGRGTDIQISDEVRRLGGLHVIATEMHSSARIDRQLIGRAARRGDPGSYQQFLSFEDELLQAYAMSPAAIQSLRRRASGTNELSSTHVAIFEKVRKHIERQSEQQRRELLLREKQVRETCEEIGLDPWLESFEMNLHAG